MEHQVLPDVSVRELMMVVALAEYGSFVAAAAYLNTSQPAVTRALKRLEKALGIALFARSTRHVEITLAGREFVAVAERMLNDLRITVRSLSDVAGEQRGQVIVSTYSAFAYQPFPQIISAYRQARPQVEIRIREGRQPDIVEDVRSGVADFGVGYIDALPEILQSLTLRSEPLYVMYPANHPLARRRRKQIRLADILQESLVSLPPDSYTRRLVDGAAAAAGGSLRHRLVLTRFESVVRYVRSGAGVAIIPAGAVPPPPWGDFHAAPLGSPSLSVTVGVITLSGRHITPPAAGLMALIQDHFNGTTGSSRHAAVPAATTARRQRPL